MEAAVICADSRIFRGESLIISTTEPISWSAIVIAQYDDLLLIGKVVAWLREAERYWAIRIKVEHTLKHLETLMRLRSEFLAEPRPLDLDLERTVFEARVAGDGSTLEKECVSFPRRRLYAKTPTHYHAAH